MIKTARDGTDKLVVDNEDSHKKGGHPVRKMDGLRTVAFGDKPFDALITVRVVTEEGISRDRPEVGAGKVGGNNEFKWREISR